MTEKTQDDFPPEDHAQLEKILEDEIEKQKGNVD